MKFSTRELVLGWVTGVTVLLGVTYWLGQPKAQEWKNAIKARDGLASSRSGSIAGARIGRRRRRRHR